MMRPAYAVEYDYLPAHQCTRDLQTKKIANLFFSGQINGTTGYEEAAGQGLVAGANAAAKALGTKPLILEREGSYLGTLIDDLVTKDLREPYRMLTSRSEYRLALRSDNADARLTPIGKECNLIDDERFKMFEDKRDTIENELARLKKFRLKESSPLVAAALEQSKNLGAGGKQSFTLEELLRRPGVTYDKFVEYKRDAGIDEIPRPLTKWEAECVEIRVKFAGFIQRQKVQIDRDLSKHGKEIPSEIDYKDIPMRLEAREKLEKVRPSTIGQASRVGGVTPADINSLLIHMEVLHREKEKAPQ
jgi:tRNA uridine 5-carboxymethylaminomethyl modification enzyme